MKVKKIIIEYENEEPLEIILKDSETFNFSQTNGSFEGWDEKTNSVKRMPNGKRYITINVLPSY